MSTQPHMPSTDATPRREPRTASTSFALRNAPYTFSTTNTDPCPQMFADKWAAGD
ncbi:hypothetical protein ACKVMT_06405 [Halobacteriales archaeon Cl-PHB]